MTPKGCSRMAQGISTECRVTVTTIWPAADSADAGCWMPAQACGAICLDTVETFRSGVAP